MTETLLVGLAISKVLVLRHSESIKARGLRRRFVHRDAQVKLSHELTIYACIMWMVSLTLLVFYRSVVFVPLHVGTWRVS